MPNGCLDLFHRAGTDACRTRPIMHPTLSHHEVLAFDPIAPRDATLVLDHARSLQRAAAAGELRASLRGRKLGLLCEACDDDDLDGDAALFRRAAVELGAHVAHIRPSLTELSTQPEVQRTARMLGRLYDAIECQGMAADLVHQVGVEAGVPVYDGVASPKHPTARLADLLEGNASKSDKRRFVLQAVLLSTIA
jgi:ornithine carbamoyltransferase